LKEGFGVGCAYWLASMVSIAFAAGPWFHWRFSLRTLLIGMTLLAVVLGAIVYAMR
jgi:hypothetical protein